MSKSFKVYYYLSASGGNPVKDFINSLSPKQQAKIRRVFQSVETYGLQAVLPHVKKLTGTPLWEIRILGKDNIRVIYIIPKKEAILALHGFIKKGQKTSKSDLSLALKRHKDWLERSRSLDS